MTATRNEVIDIMKGITIILVIIGHMHGPLFLHTFIYTFHMPLFFVLAGYFFSPKSDIIAAIKKDARRLLVPYFFVVFLLIIYSIAVHGIRHDLSQLLQSGVIMVGIFPDGFSLRKDIQTPVIPVWFLFSLFWSKTLFRIAYKYIKEQYVIILFFIVSCIGVFINIKLPFAFMQGIIASFFYGVGILLRERERERKKKDITYKYTVFLFIVIWIVCLVWGDLDMAYGYYKLYIIELLGALGGTYFIYIISKYIQQTKVISIFLQWFGINSLIVLCVHTLERFIPIWAILHINNYFVLLFCKICLCCIAIILCYHLKITKYIFKLK